MLIMAFVVMSSVCDRGGVREGCSVWSIVGAYVWHSVAGFVGGSVGSCVGSGVVTAIVPDDALGRHGVTMRMRRRQHCTESYQLNTKKKYYVKVRFRKNHVVTRNQLDMVEDKTTLQCGEIIEIYNS